MEILLSNLGYAFAKPFIDLFHIIQNLPVLVRNIGEHATQLIDNLSDIPSYFEPSGAIGIWLPEMVCSFVVTVIFSFLAIRIVLELL